MRVQLATGWGSPSGPSPRPWVPVESHGPVPAPRPDIGSTGPGTPPARVLAGSWSGPPPAAGSLLGSWWDPSHGSLSGSWSRAPSPPLGPCWGHGPRAPPPRPWVPVGLLVCAPPHTWSHPAPARSFWLLQGSRASSASSPSASSGQHRPAPSMARALRAQRSWEVAEDASRGLGVSSAVWPLCRGAPSAMPKALEGAGELLPGSAFTPAALSAPHFSLLPLGSQGHTKTRAQGRKGQGRPARSWF